jgi:hypothetical protein
VRDCLEEILQRPLGPPAVRGRPELPHGSKPFLQLPIKARKLSRPNWSQAAQRSASGPPWWLNVLVTTGVFKKVLEPCGSPERSKRPPPSGNPVNGFQIVYFR